VRWWSASAAHSGVAVMSRLVSMLPPGAIGSP
jgi:hypothetical protein